MYQKTHGVIAAGHQKTAEAGTEMFRLGGNAFDAAIAAVLASFVAESMMTSAGGGGFMLAHTQEKENILFDFFSQTPRQKLASEVDFYPIEFDFGDTVQTFHIGLGSMAVPGNLRGVFEIHRRLGKLPLMDVAAPAIDYAKNGIVISEFQAYCLKLLEPIISNLEVYTPGGKPLKAGDILVMTDLAATLTEVAKNGVEEFYAGDVARQLVKDCQEKGGYLTLEDLMSYQVIVREPLVVNYRGSTLLTNPPPSSGGSLIAFALELLSSVNFRSLEFGSSSHLQLLTEVMRLTNTARNDYDTLIYDSEVAQQFLSAENIAPYTHALTTNVVNKWGSTTHISVLDDQGNAAAVTTSNGEGCGYIIPGTGIMMNNMLGEDDLNPQGFHQWQANQRISSMMSPTMVLNNGEPEIVLGSGGSKRIRTAILQVISNLIDWRMSVVDAVTSPRCHWDEVLNIEPGFSRDVDMRLTEKGDELVLWTQKSLFFGGVHTVRRTTSGMMEGSGDSRRHGVVLME